MRAKFPTLPIFLACILYAGHASAVTLDWDQNAWAPSPTPAPNVTSSSFDVDSASAGSDVTITATASANAAWQASLPAPNPMTPVVSKAFQGGDTSSATIHNSLELAVDFGAKPKKSTADIYITVMIDFSAQYVNGVSNVSFSLFDIDSDNNPNANSTYQDEITNIVATTTSGGTIAADVTNLGSSVTPGGTGTGQTLTGNAKVDDTGAASGNGNATISFNGDYIRSVTFTYLANQFFSDPTYQHIGIGDITFTPVPEINPSWSAVVSCIAAAGLILRHRASVRK